jgi:hypothetical protein
MKGSGTEEYAKNYTDIRFQKVGSHSEGPILQYLLSQG